MRRSLLPLLVLLLAALPAVAQQREAVPSLAVPLDLPAAPVDLRPIEMEQRTAIAEPSVEDARASAAEAEAARRRAAALVPPAWYRAEYPAGSRTMATITVNTLDGGNDGICGTDGNDPLQDCSLLEAIDLANSNADADVIAFSVDGTIPIASTVVVTSQVEIDGTTAPGGAHAVRIDASAAQHGFRMGGAGASGSVIRGLVIGQAFSSGVFIEPGATGVHVVGNLIGTDATGADLGNALGVTITGPDNVVGGAAHGAGNTIGHNRIGVYILNAGATGNRVVGNLIGTDATGADLGNALGGVWIEASPGNTVGGALSGEGNTIGRNGQSGVFIFGTGATGNAVLGNHIGTDATGTDLGNAIDGVTIASANNTVGGAAASEGNTIGRNGRNGMIIGGAGNRILGNHIGTDATGADLGNAFDGVRISQAPDNVVGGALPGEGNTIGRNGQSGVFIFGTGATGNAILANSVFDNGWLGVDLAVVLSGVTANDGCGDADAGPNGFQNFPVLSSASTAAGATTVDFDLDTAEGSYRVEFFAVTAPDPSGHGEGRTFLGAQTVAVSAGCTETFEAVLPAVPAGEFVTATATPIDADQPSGFGGTSEYSAALLVESGNQAPTANAGDDQTVIAGQTVTLDGSGSSDPDGDALSYAWTLNGPGYADAALTGVGPTFCAALDGAYTASLVVSDGTDDSAPDAVTVTAITATAALDALLADVEALRAAGVLNGGQARGLARNLTQAKTLLGKGKTAEALDALDGFRRQALSLWQNDGVLTEAQALTLVASVDAVTVAVDSPCTVGSAIAGGTSASRGSEGGVPGAFALSPAYPNPFAVSATVAFEVAEAARVRLVVYDVLGREVAVLADGPFEASRHEAVFDAAGLPSGTYLVRMTTSGGSGGGFAQTQRLTLTR